MAALFRLCEACLLCAMGTFMVVLATSSEYWRFIHPKYAWLSFGAGCVITLLGACSIFNTSRKARVSELAGLLLFSGIAFSAIHLPTPFQAQRLDDLGPDDPPRSFTGLPRAVEEAAAPRLTIRGKEYVKINEAELIVLDGDHRTQPGDGFAIQGMAVRTKELDALGAVAVARLFISCCFADASATAYLVRVARPEKIKDGEWIRVAGRIQPAEEKMKNIILPVRGAISTVIGENYLLQADDIQKTTPTGLPFLFEIREHEPYAY